jgi:two-component system heavy metal sensor histidine kinase CusS
LATRLTVWYAGSAFLLILAASGFLYWALRANLDREDDELLADKIQVFRVLLRDRPDDAAALAQEVEWESTSRQYGKVYVRILDERGATLLETPGMSAVLPADAFSPESGSEKAMEWDAPGGQSFRVLTTTVALGPSGDSSRRIQVALDRTQEMSLLAGYRRSLWLALGVALVVCTALGRQIARRGLRPIVEMTETARRIRSTTLDERIGIAGLPSELFALANTFNDMLDRLENSFKRLARFSADIAHELRTPVNNLRGEAEVALGQDRSPADYREVLGSCLEECGRLARLIDSLLFLARAESPHVQVARERLDVGQELQRVCEFYEAAAVEAGVALTVSADDGIEADLDRTLFQRALSNLLANALAHTPKGGKIVLSATREGSTVRVAVADNGSGIAAEHLPHVFDRFYRVDAARSTEAGRVGLGLSIVQRIAALHDGSAMIGSTVGKGTCVSLWFPGEIHEGRVTPRDSARSGPSSLDSRS